MAKNERFVVIQKEGSLFSRRVLVDKETGVNYLWVSEGYAGGLTPLLDRDGKPVITTINYLDE